MNTEVHLLPQPKQIEIKNGCFRLKHRGSIRVENSSLYPCAKLLGQELRQVTGFAYTVTTETCLSKRGGSNGDILLRQEDYTRQEDRTAESAQNYRISITEQGICLTGYGAAGVLYAVQTLRQLLRQFGTVLPVLEIRDEPAIANRGFYYDVSRGRIPAPEELKRLAEVCSFYKINQLQLYIEDSYLFEGFSETWRGTTPLTAEDILELDEYCAGLQIELVPSLSSFGHLYGVLRTKQYGHLNELEDDGREYYLTDRMAHHTVDVTNEESFDMVRDRILDYMRLFRSDKFNICADETFDLGKGKSRAEAEKRGTTELYLEFLQKLCGVVLDAGKVPMFWGDVILENPDNIRRLPEKAICLNWEYAPEVKEDNLRTFTNAGAKHIYVCPGVQSWHYLINNHHDAFLNISGMCRNAHRYKAEGVLNTCWGDLGHAAHPEFATVGLAYGAAFSWSEKELAEQDINRSISVLAYGDMTGKAVEYLSELGRLQDVRWWNVVAFQEYIKKGKDKRECCETLLKQDAAMLQEHVRRIETLMQEISGHLRHIEDASRHKIAAYLLFAEGQLLFTKTACAVTEDILQEKSVFPEQPEVLAAMLEEWFMEYKKLWRSCSKESELHRLTDVVSWYADYLREIV